MCVVSNTVALQNLSEGCCKERKSNLTCFQLVMLGEIGEGYTFAPNSQHCKASRFEKRFTDRFQVNFDALGRAPNER